VVFSFAVIAALVFATMKGPSQSQSTSPAIGAGPGTPVVRVATGEHVYHGEFDLDGRRGSLHVSLRFGSVTGRAWTIGPGYGQYRQISGRGKGFQAGGHASEWYARLRGFVTTHDGSRQRVVIVLSGRPDGTFTLNPVAGGTLKRDSGTQSSGWLG
jgi:hypothetical protein